MYPINIGSFSNVLKCIGLSVIFSNILDCLLHKHNPIYWIVCNASQFIGLSVIYPFKSEGIANMHDPIYWIDYHT